jgi:hypothetical protein
MRLHNRRRRHFGKKSRSSKCPLRHAGALSLWWPVVPWMIGQLKFHAPPPCFLNRKHHIRQQPRREKASTQITLSPLPACRLQVLVGHVTRIWLVVIFPIRVIPDEALWVESISNGTSRASDCSFYNTSLRQERK